MVKREKKEKAVEKKEKVAKKAEKKVEKQAEKKEKRSWFKKKEKPVVQEPAVENEGTEEIKGFQRKKRIVEEEKTATVEEVKEVVKPSIFKMKADGVREYDYLEQRKEVSRALYQDSDHEDEEEADTLVIAQEIADAFEIKNYRTEESESIPIFEVEEEPEPEPEEPEPEPESEPESVRIDRSGEDVLERLKADTEDYRNRVQVTNGEYCDVVYSTKSVPKVVTSDGKMKLANHRVFVNGKEQHWDYLYEMKVPKGSRVDVDTGVGVVLPTGASIELAVAESTLAKYSLRVSKESKTVFSRQEAVDPLIVSFVAEEGAYLSKIGRVVECQIVV